MQSKPKPQWKYLLLWLAIIPACMSTQPQINQQQMQDVQEKIVWSSHKEAPVWYITPPESDGRYDYFVGHSVRFAAEPAARDEAMNNAVKQFVQFCGVEVKVFDEYLKTTTGKTSSVLAGELSAKQSEKQEAQAFVSNIKPREWYLRKVQTLHDGTPIDIGWVASVLVMVPVDEKARVQDYAQKTKAAQKTEEHDKHRAEVDKVKSALQSAADLYLKAQTAIQNGNIFGAIKLLDKAQAIVNQNQPLSQFAEARNALYQETKAVDFDQIGIIQDSLLRGISLVKISGDGQNIPSGQGLPQPLVIKTVCNYENKEIPVSLAEIEFRLDGSVIEKISTDKNGLGQLLHYTFDNSSGNIRVVAKLNAEVQKEVYFNLVISQPVGQKREKISVDSVFK